MTEAIAYTDAGSVEAVRVESEAPRYGVSASGYGGKIPTRYMLKYAGKWRRVYMAQYGNSGSPYIVVAGADHWTDTATDYLLEWARDRGTGEHVPDTGARAYVATLEEFRKTFERSGRGE
jgi:hypothetical protein